MTGSRLRHGQHPNASWGPGWQKEYDKFVESCLLGKFTTCPYCNHPVYFPNKTEEKV